MLTRMRAKDVVVYGTKASNLGEIVTANLDGVRVPPGFGVPFYYYVQHMKQNGLDKQHRGDARRSEVRDGRGVAQERARGAAQGDHRRADRSGRRST